MPQDSKSSKAAEILRDRLDSARLRTFEQVNKPWEAAEKKSVAEAVKGYYDAGRHVQTSDTAYEPAVADSNPFRDSLPQG